MSEYSQHSKKQLMDRIISVRYTDNDIEQRLSKELLQWADKNKDTYAKIFAHVYLADSYIAQNKSAEAVKHLMEAKSMISPEIFCPELLLKLYLFLALVYTRQGDEQLGAQFYMHALAQARRVKDVVTESVVLNNIAVAFQKHRHYEEALRYYEEAFKIRKDNGLIRLSGNICGSLSQVLIALNRLDEAKEYIEKGEHLLSDHIVSKKTHQCQNWCSYYAAAGDKKQALLWANRVIDNIELFYYDVFTAFAKFNILYQSMYDIGEQSYAKIFLHHMECVAEKSGLSQSWSLKKKQIEYSLKFESEEHHIKMYKDFYWEHRKYKEQSDMVIVNAMKTKVNLEELLIQREELQSQQETLEYQANIDEMTQIYNRRFYEQLLEEYSKKSLEKNFGAILFDIDYFKEYNDSYGHMCGDEAIKIVASCLAKNSTERIYTCRFGGDEFVCICDGLEQKEIEQYICEVRKDLYKYKVIHEYSKCSDRLTLSIGYAIQQYSSYHKENICKFDPYIVVKEADKALYAAKFSGRNSYLIK